MLKAVSLTVLTGFVIGLAGGTFFSLIIAYAVEVGYKIVVAITDVFVLLSKALGG